MQKFSFERARILASVDHPNVCKIFELCQERGRLFLSMEWVNGAPLSALLSAVEPAQRLDVSVAAFVVAQALGGLHAIHEKGVQLETDGDATPHNLLLTLEGDVKFVDFSIVESRNQQGNYTREIQDTLSYLTPERLSGAKVDRRADIYTLGCVLYEITTGHSPFDSQQPAQTLEQIALGNHPRPTSLLAGYPEQLEAIVTQAMALNPDDRFRTADEVRLSLEAFVAHSGRKAPRESLAGLVARHCGTGIRARRDHIRAAQELLDPGRKVTLPSLMRQGAPAPRPGTSMGPDPPFADSAQHAPNEGPGQMLAPERPPETPTSISGPSTVRRERKLAAAISAAVPGVRGCCVGDLEGHLLDEHDKAARARDLLLVSVALARHLVAIGAPFDLGRPDLVSTKGAQSTLVMTYRPECIIATDVEPNHPLKKIEEALRKAEWQSANEWVLTDREIEYLPGDDRGPDRVSARPPPRRKADEALIVTGQSAPESLTLEASVAEACAELRDALIKGQLSSAASLATRLGKLPSPAQHPFGSGDAEPVIRPLLNAIANILAGDSNAGLARLEVVREAVRIGPSLNWVAQVWSARASSNVGDGLEAAAVYAESALRLAADLDVNARAVSTLLVAEIKSHLGDFGGALELIEIARGLFTAVSDSQERAECWLLEARVLLALGRSQESIHAAERSRECRPSWPAPVTFVVKHALHAGHLEQAMRALQPLLSRIPIPFEAERDRYLLEQVRIGAVPAAVACQYLVLLEAPAGRDGLRKLQEIVARYPHVDSFGETLGWKLLRAGQHEAAKTVFKRLSARAALPDHLRASVLLGLGCLATGETESEVPSARVWAAVNAASKASDDNRLASPAVSPAEKNPKTDPFDRRVVQMGRTPTPGNWSLKQTAALRKPHAGPVFSGSLREFGLPDLLELLRAGQRTGTLVLSSVAGIGAVQLRSGKVTGAAAPSSKPLTDYLLDRNSITTEQLRQVEALPVGRQPAPPIEVTLIDKGVVSVEQMRQALRDQVLVAFGQLVTWSEGQFAFDPSKEATPTPSAVEVDLDPQAILLEVYTRMDEQSNSLS